MSAGTRRQLGLGALSGVAAAILFGLSAPIAKLLLPGASPYERLTVIAARVLACWTVTRAP